MCIRDRSKGVSEYINEEGFPEWIHHYFKDDLYSYMKTVEIIQNIIDMDIVKWLDILNITLEEFANNYGVPFRTAQDWKFEKTHLKGYIKDLLCYTVYTVSYTHLQERKTIIKRIGKVYRFLIFHACTEIS